MTSAWTARVRPALAGIALAGITALFVPSFLAVYPVTAWFAPRLVQIVGLLALFSIASLASGSAVLRRLQGPAPRDGQFALAFATGVLVFGLGIAALGHLQLLRLETFWLFPLVLTALGADALADAAVRFARKVRDTERLGWVELVLLFIGVIGVVMAVIPALVPDNTNYDARWYHLGIAERYVAEGGITAASEGNHLIAGPHLASLLYTWAFLAPLPLFERVVLANLIEVVCFLGTLALIPPLARAISPTARKLRMAWVALLLFPLLYVYDTGLMGGADHVASLWAPAAVLTWFQARERDDASSWSLFGAQLAAVALAKYTSVILVVPLVIAVVLANVTGRASVIRRLRGPVIAGGVALVITAAHWLRNVAFYGNPVYPLAPKLFPTHPWTQDSAAWRLRYARELFVPADGSLLMRLGDTAQALWNYHLNTYTWGDFTANLPVFGFLYAASLVALPFLKNAKRLWLLAVLVHVGIALWFNLAHQLRYLTLFVPLMAAACAVVAAELWAWKNVFTRVVVFGVVSAQLFLASDVPFLPTHRLNGRTAPLVRGLQFLGAGPSDAKQDRFRAFADWQQIGAALPPQARVLIHFAGTTLGIARVTYTDAPGIQYGLDYAELGSVSRVHAKLRELGVTHLGFRRDVDQPESVAGELLFRATAATATDGDRVLLHGWTFAPLAAVPPPDPAPSVAYLGCGTTYQTGRYELADLGTPAPPSNADAVWANPRSTGEPATLMEGVSYVVREESCASAPRPGPEFEDVGTQHNGGTVRVFYRRR
ncbi:MAG: hypothetical protein ACO1OB_23640 [Archangium sp.]